MPQCRGMDRKAGVGGSVSRERGDGMGGVRGEMRKEGEQHNFFAK